MLAVLFSVAVLASSAYGREYNCTVNEALCTGSGAHTVFVNGVSMCCPPTATVNMNNNKCVCVESPAAFADCRQGLPNCRQANSFSTDSKGQMRCCLPGYALNSAVTSGANGEMVEVCKCLPITNGGFFSTFMGMGNGGNGMFMSGSPGLTILSQSGQNAGNSTDILKEWKKMGDEWKNWGRQFAQGFRTWGQNFGQNMRNTGLDLARNLSGVLQTTLRRTAQPIQTAVQDLIGNIFRSIPGY